MRYGIERAYPDPQEKCLGIETAAQQFGVSVGDLEQYAREGLLIPLKNNGSSYYTESDDRWVSTLKSLVGEAHLSFDDIRHLLSHCPCWKYRHCDFHSKSVCPLNQDPSKPCWINRKMCTVLSSYPCRFCIVYRSAPECESIRAVLSTPTLGISSEYGYYGG